MLPVDLTVIQPDKEEEYRGITEASFSTPLPAFGSFRLDESLPKRLKFSGSHSVQGYIDKLEDWIKNLLMIKISKDVQPSDVRRMMLLSPYLSPEDESEILKYLNDFREVQRREREIEIVIEARRQEIIAKWKAVKLRLDPLVLQANTEAYKMYWYTGELKLEPFVNVGPDTIEAAAGSYDALKKVGGWKLNSDNTYTATDDLYPPMSKSFMPQGIVARWEMMRTFMSVIDHFLKYGPPFGTMAAAITKAITGLDSDGKITLMAKDIEYIRYERDTLSSTTLTRFAPILVLWSEGAVTVKTPSAVLGIQVWFHTEVVLSGPHVTFKVEIDKASKMIVDPVDPSTVVKPAGKLGNLWDRFISWLYTVTAARREAKRTGAAVRKAQEVEQEQWGVVKRFQLDLAKEVKGKTADI